MTDDVDVLRLAHEWGSNGRGVALAAVVSTSGSAPRPVGSFLAVNDAQGFAGSVSGGCVEADVVREALLAIADGKPRHLRYGASRNEALDVGLACGGSLDVHVQRLRGDGTLTKLLAEVSSRRPVVLAMDLGRGELRLVDPRAPDPGPEEPVAAAARAALERDEAARVEASGGPWFVRPFSPRIRVVAVGAVHIAQALVQMVRLAGWEPLVVDARSAFATEARFEGVPLVCAWPDEALARVGLDRRTAVVTLTHDPKLDDAALGAALRSDVFYVGALGSRRTQAARRERLRALGFGDADLARIHGPAGLSIGARSPAEISVSILAEIVAELRAGPAAKAIQASADPGASSSMSITSPR